MKFFVALIALCHAAYDVSGVWATIAYVCEPPVNDQWAINVAPSCMLSYSVSHHVLAHRGGHTVMTFLHNACRSSHNSAALENPSPVESSIDLDGFPELRAA